MSGDTTGKGFRRSRLLLWVLLLCVLAGAGWAGLASHGGWTIGPGGGAKGGLGMASDVSTRGVTATRPLIDGEGPTTVETATFALG